MKDIGSDILLHCNDELSSNRKPYAQNFNKEYGACGLKVSDGLRVIFPIDDVSLRQQRVDAFAGCTGGVSSDLVWYAVCGGGGG
jgi:hypothetical protein